MDDLARLSALRAHRHEVMNALQVVKGYLQLNRGDRALRALDRLADRMSDYSRLQGSIAPEEADLVWCAIGLGRVRVGRWCPGLCRAPDRMAAVCNFLCALDRCAAVRGVDEVLVEAVDRPRAALRLCVAGEDAGDLRGQDWTDWWHTVQQEAAVSGLRWAGVDGREALVVLEG
ncbi:Spo0B domain-containing protein [Alicyclobacillus sp.]|uniref:Spo0B domain-containing protein n=1 Tax=Alicyclobacillus sp. TaxID=61169 RepID=UPI0025C4A5FC|nr:Spo0B domain-containing protein [Alicyclobacillus sp.]MCL6516165.1 Spo0B domain-containing protein [Alicyclobacillus sp.]